MIIYHEIVMEKRLKSQRGDFETGLRKEVSRSKVLRHVGVAALRAREHVARHGKLGAEPWIACPRI